MADSRILGVVDRKLAAVALLAGAYFVAGKLGLLLASVHPSATAVWPPTGIALAAFLLMGHRVWPGILLGAFLVNVTTFGSVLSSIGIATGNTLEGLVGAWLIGAFANGRRVFERPQDVFKFAFLAAVTSTVVSATLGVTSLALTGYASWSSFGPIWLTWWLGDAGGDFVVAPLLVLWASSPVVRWDRGRTLEVAALLLALALTGVAVFGGLHVLSVDHYPFEFLSFPVLVWAAFRFGPREAATAIFLLSGMAVWGTLGGFGPFVRESANESLLLLQAFMGVASVMSMALAAAVVDRQRAEQAIRAAEERLRVTEEHKVEARDEFLSVAAHELKTPMTSLQLAVQFLLRQLDRGTVVEPQQLVRALRMVDEQSVKLARLVAQLMETVRLRAGRLEVDMKVEDVGSLVARVVEQTQATTGRHWLVLSRPPRVLARVDALRLEEVVTNLLDNAIKFSPSGGRIDVEVSTPDAETVRLAVRDHGVGIPPHYRPHVFDRFSQVRPDSQGSGLGLGLYVSRRIVDLHGGRIEAEAPEDGGTRIVVSLPTDVEEPVRQPEHLGAS